MYIFSLSVNGEFFARVLPCTMPSVLRLRRHLNSQSPPSSPRAEQMSPPRAPYPVPGPNPASQYALLEKLGTGSFGTVYKAMHNETKQIVAIKQIGISSLPPLTLLCLILLQTWKIQMTTYQRYNRR